MISPPLLDNEATAYPPGLYPGAWLDESGSVVTDEDGNPILLGPDTLYPPDLGDGPQAFAPLGMYQGVWLDEYGNAVLDEDGAPITVGADSAGGLEPPLLGDGPPPLPQRPPTHGGRTVIACGTTTLRTRVLRTILYAGLTLELLLLATLATAAPSVSGITGTLANSESITISGSGFGTTGKNVAQVGRP